MNRILPVVIAAFAVAACSDLSPVAPLTSLPSSPNAAFVDGDVIVSSSNDAGPGSFRDAIAQANANASIQSIGFLPEVNSVDLASPITFTGTQDLTINGNRATINGAGAGGTAFTTTKGADLTLIGLTFRDAAGEGVHVEIPPSATGTTRISLINVDIIGNASHGVLVNDQLDPSTVDGVQPNPNGSAASLEVLVIDSRFIGNGYSVSDRDGLRVNEGGLGDLSLKLEGVRAEGNAADGVEIDERGTGNVVVDVSGTTLTKNGPFDPNDLDDGFDIDEYNDGSIIGSIVNTTASHNFEEGLDFNENNAGDLRVNMTNVTASSNGEEGIDFEEDDDFANGGDLVTVMSGIRTFDNGDGADGALKIREKSGGNLDVTLSDVISSHNIGSGIFVRESGGGNAVVNIDNVVSNANKAGALDPFSLGHGIEIVEGGAGNLTATVTSSTISSNAGNGVFASKEDPGTHSVTVSDINGAANALGPVGGIATAAP